MLLPHARRFIDATFHSVNKKPLAPSQLPKGCPSHLHNLCKACGGYNEPQAVEGRYQCLKCTKGTYYVSRSIAKASERAILKEHNQEREKRLKEEEMRQEAERQRAAAIAARKPHLAQQVQQGRREKVGANPTAPLERRYAQRKRSPSAAKIPWMPTQDPPPVYVPQALYAPMGYPPNGLPIRPLPPVPASSSQWF